MKLKQSREGP